MAGNIKGITIEFRGDTTKLDKALRTVQGDLRKTQNELTATNKALKFNPTNVELWRNKQQLLTTKIGETEEKLKALKQAQAKMDAEGVDKNSQEYMKLRREIIETESQLKVFKAELKAIGNVNIRALGEQFKKIGDKMKDVGSNMTRHVTAPLAGVAVASAKVGMDFDSAMSQVAATMGKTNNEIQDLREFAKEMGSTTAFSATQAAEGLNYMALAGYDSKQAMEMLPTVLNLAAAGAMELGAASDMVTDAQTALGLSMEQTTVMVDQMAKASSKSNTSVEQLGNAILKIGPTAKTMSGGTRELTQVLGVLADNGIKGEEAGTHLRNVLLSMNTDKVKDAFHELGVEVFDAQGNMRDLSEVFPELSKAMDGMTSEERTGMLQKLFNKTDLASLNALLDTSKDRWTELGAAIEDSTGAAGQMAETQLDNMKGSLTLLKSALEGAGISIGEVLAPAIRKVAEWITKLVDKFNNLSPTAKKVIVVIGAIAAAIGPLLLVVGTLLSTVGTIMIYAPMIGTALAGLAGPIGIAIVAIGALVAAGVWLYKNWDTIKAKAIEIKDAVAQKFNELKDGITNVFNTIKTFITQVWTAIKTIITTVLQFIVTLITARFQLMLTIATTVFNAIRTVATTVWNGIRSVVTSVANAIHTAVSSRFNALKSAVTSTFNSIKSTATSVWNSIKSAITAPIEAARDKVQGVMNKIKGFFPIKVGRLINFSVPSISLNTSSKTVLGKTITYPTGFSVSWHKQGGIFMRPTLLQGADGLIHGVGDVRGGEAVLPIESLQGMIDASVARNNAVMAQQTQILAEMLEELRKEKNFKVDDRWAGRYGSSLGFVKG